MLTIIRANAIPDTDILICMDEDVAYVGTIHALDSKWI